jgi:hypothetical protein
MDLQTAIAGYELDLQAEGKSPRTHPGTSTSSHALTRGIAGARQGRSAGS